MKKLQYFIVFILFEITLKAQTPIQIEYLLVPNDFIAKHEEHQNEEMKSYHQGLLEERKIYAWYHYKSRFPLGKQEGYNYIIVTVCSDYDVLNARNKDMTYKDWVTRTEIYYPNRKVRSPDYGVIQTPYITVDFLKRNHKEPNEYTDRLADKIKPVLDQRVKDNVVVNYSIFDLMKTSEELGYDHVLVTRCGSFNAAQVPAPVESEELNYRIKTVLWELQEIVFLK